MSNTVEISTKIQIVANEGRRMAIRTRVVIAGMIYLLAIINTQPEMNIPYSTMGIIYDYSKS